MLVGSPRSACKLLLIISLAGGIAVAGDLRIKIPKRTKPTPVQKLNQDGVKALSKRDYKKAKQLFYKAYLIDPNDPFTLNNLGYIAEIEGEGDRAMRFYDLSAQNATDATVDRALSKDYEGKTIAQVAGKAGESALAINRMNVEALGLLQQGRAPEADVMLAQVLALDPKNPFTLNNMGFAKEKEGELEQALSFYSKSAQTGSHERVVVSPNKDWKGKPINEIAADNADAVRKSMQRGEDVAARVARFNLRGVSALNRNDRDSAREDFQQAYRLDAGNAFALNNMGYIAELDGDKETASFYYEKAQMARNADHRVDLATRRDAEGKQLGVVADGSDQLVAGQMEALVEAKRRAGGPIELKRRDGSNVVEPTGTAPALPASQPQSIPANQQTLPAGDRSQPPVQSVAPSTPQTAPQTQPVPQTQPIPPPTNPQ